MAAADILDELKAMGSPSTKKVLLTHGAREPFYGVKVGDLKSIQKREKGNQALAMELYATGVSDAMYLAGLLADGGKMTKAQLQEWVQNAYWSMLSEYTVPWVAVESKYGTELAEEWIASDSETVAAAGWNTWAGLVSVKNDEELDMNRLRQLLAYVEKNIHGAQNRVRYCMNGFIISVGAYVKELSAEAVETGKRVGTVKVNMGGTACQVPDAPAYIAKSIGRGSLNKKKKTVKC